MTHKKHFFLSLCLILFLSLFAFLVPKYNLRASTTEELQNKIDDIKSQRAQIEAEIAKYQTEIQKTGTEAKTLQSAISTLDAQRNKLTADLSLTENQINTASLTIEKLNLNIADKEDKIAKNTASLGDALETIQEEEQNSVLENILSYGSVSEVWDELEKLQTFQKSVKDNITETKSLEAELVSNKNDKENQKNQLVDLKSTLNDKQKIVDQNKKDKANLLTATKNKEADYQKILVEKKALSAQFEAEQLQFESQLKLAIDPNSIPSASTGILSWPLDSVFITQYFGNTEFSKTTTAYNGQGHNGIDLRASVGTPVKAALSGTIEGTGDTDTVCAGASYGKWVLITHGNGLSTLYAHFSLIKVVPGQKVSTGDIIGYSGNTGFTTGPHLHLTVYASQGVKIMQRKSAVCQGTYTMPLADIQAYLNPLLYLPPLPL